MFFAFHAVIHHSMTSFLADILRSYPQTVFTSETEETVIYFSTYRHCDSESSPKRRMNQSFLIAVPECMILTSHLPRSPCVFSSVSLDAVHPSAACWLLERRLCGSLSTVFQGGEWDSDPSLDEPGPPGSMNSCFQAKILHIILDLSAPLLIPM